VWIPEDQALRQNILLKNHDDPIGSYYSVDRTVDVLKRKYYWPGLRANVHKYIRYCAAC
jgi:hypothetical protein